MQQSTELSDPPGSSLRIEVDVKSSRRLKECFLSDVDAPSFRLYNGVPFEWESHPGKSKAGGGDDAASSALPPLTPPPRHFCAEDAKHSDDNNNNNKKQHKRSSKKKKSCRFRLMIKTIPRVFSAAPWKVRSQLICPATSSSLSSPLSSPFSRFGSSRSSATSSSMSSCRGDDVEVGAEGRAESSSSDVVCFRVRRVPCTLFFCSRG